MREILDCTEAIDRAEATVQRYESDLDVARWPRRREPGSFDTAGQMGALDEDIADFCLVSTYLEASTICPAGYSLSMTGLHFPDSISSLKYSPISMVMLRNGKQDSCRQEGQRLPSAREFSDPLMRQLVPCPC